MLECLFAFYAKLSPSFFPDCSKQLILFSESCGKIGGVGSDSEGARRAVFGVLARRSCAVGPPPTVDCSLHRSERHPWRTWWISTITPAARLPPPIMRYERCENASTSWTMKPLKPPLQLGPCSPFINAPSRLEGLRCGIWEDTRGRRMQRQVCDPGASPDRKDSAADQGGLHMEYLTGLRQRRARAPHNRHRPRQRCCPLQGRT